MAETYKPIFPGNAVAHLHSYGLPNESFTTNGRSTGDPRDRRHQALVSIPGWLSVRKVGYSLIAGAGATSFDIIVPSPDTRPDDKPRADIVGMHIPTGAAVYRAGFRVLPINRQPGFNASGYQGDEDNLDSGLTGTATDLLALSSAAIGTKAAGSIGATAIRTSSDNAHVSDPAVIVVDAGGKVVTGTQKIQTAFGAPVVTTTDLTLKLYSVAAAGNTAGSAIGSSHTGGCYVVVEVDYLVPEAIAPLDALPLPGHKYSGFGS